MGGQWTVWIGLLSLFVHRATAQNDSALLLSHCNKINTTHSYCGPCAPDDYANECRDGDRFRLEHILPDEWELMLDSRDYQNLVQDSSPVWNRHDADGDGRQWIQRGGICQYDLRACEYEQGPQDNWVFTQHIKYPAGSLTTDIYLNVSYRFSQCSGNPACTNDYVTLYQFDTNSLASGGAQNNPTNYLSTPLFGPGTETTDSRLQQTGGSDRSVLRNFSSPGNYSGFYLGIRDTGTCGQVKRILLYYTPCKELLDGLVYYPELVRPPASTDSCYTAEACCAPNSHPTTSLSYRACSDGRCERNVTCECDPGYEIADTGRECDACPAGTYRSSTDPQDTCISCPMNTLTDSVVASECPCMEGYYRDTTEGPGDKCTSGPSSPVSVTVQTGSTWTFVEWGRPVDLGGRDDTYYIIEYQEVSSTDDFIPGCTTEGLSCNITGLRPVTEYRFRVIAENGVTDQDNRLGIRGTRTTVALGTTQEGLPSVPLGVQALPGVVVWEPPANPNGDITGYDVRFLGSSQRQIIVPKKPTVHYEVVSKEDTSGLGNRVQVQVRAKNFAGAGQWSAEQANVPGCQPPKPAEQDCLPLQNIPNGVVLASKLIIGGVASYSCLSGYSLIGSLTRTCQANGSWSGQQPKCVTLTIVQCPIIGNPPNGRVSVCSRLVDDVATYSCSQGFTLVGSASRTCLSTGRWSGNVPTCQSEVYFSFNGRNYSNGSRVPIDHIGTGDNALLCITSNTDCCAGDPKAGDFYYPDGSPVNYFDAGVYRNRGSRVVRLNLRNRDRVRSGIYRCEVPDSRNKLTSIVVELFGIECPSLSGLSNGVLHVTSQSVGGRATYSCSSGYVLNGTSIRVCGRDGHWSGSEPFCQGIYNCPPLSPPSNGTVSVSRNGGRATYSCSSGYVLNGTSVRVCGRDGRWNGSEPFCQGDFCASDLITKDRVCDPSPNKPNSCADLCCGRGFYTNEKLKPVQECQFVFCCKIECSIVGNVTVTESKCN